VSLDSSVCVEDSDRIVYLPLGLTRRRGGQSFSELWCLEVLTDQGLIGTISFYDLDIDLSDVTRARNVCCPYSGWLFPKWIGAKFTGYRGLLNLFGSLTWTFDFIIGSARMCGLFSFYSEKREIKRTAARASYKPPVMPGKKSP